MKIIAAVCPGQHHLESYSLKFKLVAIFQTDPAGCVCGMLVAPLPVWCDLGCCSRTVAVTKATANSRIYWFWSQAAAALGAESNTASDRHGGNAMMLRSCHADTGR